MHTTQEIPTIYTVDDLRRANDRIGGHFFSPDTMKFFGTRINDQCIYGGRYFITTETKAPDGVGKYYVRSFDIVTDSDSVYGYRINFGTVANFRILRKARFLARYLSRERASR